MQPDDKNRIEDLKQSLYSRNAPDIRSRRRMHISETSSEVPEQWKDVSTSDSNDPAFDQALQEARGEGRHRMPFATKFFIGSLIFCVLAVGVGAYLFLNGANFISGNNIAIDISGPVSVPGGTPVSLGVTVTNKNSVVLKNVALTVHYPSGATDPNDTTQSLEEQHESLGDIAPGGSVTKNASAVIFGEQNSQKKITADVTYGINGSNSTFTKESSYDVVVNASPIGVTVSSLQEVISGQPFQLKVDVRSNAQNTVKNVILKAAYPFGFTYKSSTQPPTTSDNTTWSIGDLPPGGDRVITINGILTGEDTDVRAFHFTVGSRSASNPNVIGTAFIDTEQILAIKKPFVSLAIGLNDDTTRNDYIGSFGKPINVTVKWANNLPETLTNVVITAHLSGNAYDKNNVSAWTGFYRSVSDDIVWDQKTNPELATVAAGANGTVTFSMTPSESQSSNSRLQLPQLNVSVQASGDRTESSNVPLTTGSIARVARIVGDVSLSGRVVRSIGSIVNTGPIPPVAERQTTYTIVWSIDPSPNQLHNAVVTASLPPGVSWTNKISPSTEDLSYDKNSGVVTWNAGDIAAAGSANSRREVQFQVALEPSVSQVGSAPIIVNQASLTAIDTWTNTTVQSTQGYLTTSFSTDPTYKAGNETVMAK
jgi:hypothetical protein